MLYLQVADQRIGPLSHQDVQDGLRSGRFQATTMSWTSGENRWTSLGRRYRHVRARPWAGPAFLFLWLVVVVAGIVLPLDQGRLVPPALREPIGYLAIAVAGCLGALVVLAMWWRHPRDPSRARPIAVFGGVALGLTVLASCGFLAMRFRAESVRSHTPDARMLVSTDGHELRIEGNVGPHFVRDLVAALEISPAVSVVELDSPGGLIDNALEAGRVLSKRNLRVRVRGKCASACVLLWASARDRELGLHARIGLHQARLDDDVPDSWKKAAFGELDPQERTVLKAAGFGPRLLEIRDSTRPESVTWLDAYELSADGVALRTVADSGRRANAMEQLAAHVLRRDTHDPTMWRFVLAYAVASPDRSLPRLTAISDAQDRDDHPTQRRLWRELGEEARIFALRHAPDHAVVQWAREMVALLRPAVDRNMQRPCGELLGTDGSGDVPTRERRMQALTHLLEATPAGSPFVPPGPAVVERARTLIRDNLSERVGHGLPSEYARWSPMQQCALLAHLWETSLRRPTPEAAAYVRYIELGS